MLLLFGILDFGRAFWTWQSLSTGAREAVRWAIVHGADGTNKISLQGLSQMEIIR